MKSSILKYSGSLIDLAGSYAGRKNIYMLSGRHPKLAFSPKASLTLGWDDVSFNKIKNFCQKEQSENNLLIGFLSYDLGLYGNNIKPRKKTKFPLVHICSFKNWVEADKDRLVVKYHDEKFMNLIEDLVNKPKGIPKVPQLKNRFDPAWDINRYKTAFEKTKQYIESGDIYQLNLSYPLTAISRSSAKDIFYHAAKANQASMFGLFQASGFDIISLSPETFVDIEQGKIETFPIKGTRAKRKDTSDETIIKDLLGDKKERAELNMISDLLRNDLGIVCNPGTVDIKSKRKTTRLSQVVHTYSHITGELRPEISSIEALLKVFPGGSISGCPKKRALEIINELEGYSRGPYTGSLFTLDPEDKLEANILIRTLIKEGDKVSLPVGGGVVFDSKYKNEYQETIDKSLSITEVFSKT